ncbi:alpha-glucosidase/alpha-galactosidase [Listeria monocytogenes serotype 1/2a]|nr:alpha-glucosidase/alpha-galactosidase [Listeria monocytogenes serotype 1/2a]
MQYTKDKVEEIKIAYIGGGSRGWAWTFMTDLAIEEQMSGTLALYDIDFDSAKKNEIIGNKITAMPEAKGKWDYIATKTIEEALTGADFVIVSILPGTFDEMHSDVHAPGKYGVYQTVGDTVGPGGMIRNLRTIPMFVEIAEAIKKYCPKAWVVNYTNPMSVCVRTLYHVFPEIKAFGCCHEVFGTQKILASIVEEKFSLENVDRSEIFTNVLGINHFTWLDYASYKGIDLFPIYQEFIDNHLVDGFVDNTEHWANSSFSSKNRVKFDLFQQYGVIAAAGDRHLVEFMPGERYLKNPEIIKSWDIEITTVDWRKGDLKERIAKSDRLVNGEEAVKIEPSGEEGILLIKALCGLARMVSNVNILNTSQQIANFPADAVVETNAIFEKDAIRPIFAGKLPEAVARLEEPHVQNQAYILEAATTYNKELVVRAFLNEPAIKNRLTQAEVVDLVDEMIKNTLDYLPKRWAEQV